MSRSVGSGLLVVLIAAAIARPQPLFKKGDGPLGPAATPFPAQHTKGLKWHDSMTEGLKNAAVSKKPICLVIAGQRPIGGC